MTGIGDELEATHRGPTGPRCSVANALDDLDEEDRAVMLDVLRGRRYSTSQVLEVLRGRKIDVSKWSMDAHRRGDCACDRRDPHYACERSR